MYKFLLLIPLFLSACNNAPNNTALGTLERERIAHTATTNEVVTALPIKPGNVVKKGMLLVKLDDTFQQAQVAKALAEVAQASASLDKLNNGARPEELAAASALVAGAKATLIGAKADYQRSLNLLKENVISQAVVDKALATKDASVANLQNTQQQLRALSNGARIEDLHIAQAKLNAANAIHASEVARLNNLTIHATRDGILDNLPWNLGERVTTGSPIAIVLAGIAPYARVYVPEPYRVHLKVGDPLVVHVDGLERSITGTLKWISSDPAFTPYFALNQKERSRLMYLAKVQLPDSEASLANGIPAQVDLP